MIYDNYYVMIIFLGEEYSKGIASLKNNKAAGR